MSSLNQVQIIGNLGKDPEVKYMPSGDAVVSVSIATSETWKDKQSGESKEKTEWHNVVFFGKLAEIVGQYLKKGSKVFVQGKLRTRKWQDKEGGDRYSTEVVVDGFSGKMVMLGGKEPSGDSRPSNANSNQRASQQQPQRTETAESSGNRFEDDDIPF